jgi:hypothetical protein
VTEEVINEGMEIGIVVRGGSTSGKGGVLTGGCFVQGVGFGQR